MKVKGQIDILNAFGYLITMIIVLLGISQFTSQNSSLYYCYFDPPGSFTCEENRVATAPKEGGIVQIKIAFKNEFTTPVKLEELACVGADEGTYIGKYTPISATIGPKERYVASLSCNELDGKPYVSKPGETFTGMFIVHYSFPSEENTRESTAILRGEIIER